MTYVGPARLLTPSAGLAIGRGWAWQPKFDGCYAEARTDAAGRLASVVSRAGRELPEAADLLGILAGPPGSVLVGELDAHTEAGIAATAARGFANLHLFDCLALAGTDLRARPYAERWGALHRAQSAVEGDGAGRLETWRDDAAGDALTLGRPRCPTTGRRVARVPRDLRRLPIVPLLRSEADARELWRDVEAGALEGLVAVRLDARAGARDGKVKIKVTDTIDARVVATSPGVLRVVTRSGTTQRAWRARPEFVIQSRGGEVPGQVVEVAHHGYYRSGEPRFARVVRTRKDLTP